MKICQRSWLSACAGLLTLALLSGCGNTPTASIPSTATIFFAHSAVFGNNSSLVTVGYNGFGQLGDGTIATPRPVAARVAGLGAVRGFAVGGDHTLAFGNNSSVFAWGSNYHGQLGSVSVALTGASAFSATPVKVPVHDLVTDVAAGAFHSLAAAGGKVWAWGFNGFGQLGDNTFVDKNVPVAVAGLSDVTSVAAGGSHSLALTADHKVQAWGYNFYGQLGDRSSGSLANRAIPNPVMINLSTAHVVTPARIEKIAAGGSTSYALGRDDSGSLPGQQLWGWGYNGAGQLGADPLTALYLPAPTLIPLLDVNGESILGASRVILKISAGLDHLLILLDDGTVWGLGFNGRGQLGNNSIINSFRFVRVYSSGTVPLSGVTDIMAIGQHSLARSRGIWYGWGDNGFGQLGQPVSTTSLGYLLVPTQVVGNF